MLSARLRPQALQVIPSSHAARAAYLGSTPVLSLLARCSLHGSPLVRASARRVLIPLLFDAAAATEAFDAPDPASMPHLLPRHPDAPHRCSKGGGRGELLAEIL